jgi:hypothetical protein
VAGALRWFDSLRPEDCPEPGTPQVCRVDWGPSLARDGELMGVGVMAIATVRGRVSISFGAGRVDRAPPGEVQRAAR